MICLALRSRGLGSAMTLHLPDNGELLGVADVLAFYDEYSQGGLLPIVCHTRYRLPPAVAAGRERDALERAGN